MKTTLKRGVGRGTGLTTKNGKSVYPPGAVSTVRHYRQPPDEKPRHGTLSRILLVTFLTLLGSSLAAVAGFLLWSQYEIDRLHATDQYISGQVTPSLPGEAAIALVVGYDKRAGKESSDISRSDTVMLIRADPHTNTISLLSFPRDLSVPIYCPKYSYPLRNDRINSAYASCGSRGTFDTVKHLINLPINYMITVNFHGFKDIVDRLGGVWMDVDRRYHHVNDGSADQNYADINLQPGYQRLPGEAALQFVRYRHTDDDYHRVARQQEFVRALKQQFAHADKRSLLSIIDSVVGNVEVFGKFNSKDVLSYAYFASSLKGGHFFQEKIENVTGYGVSYAPTSSIQTALNRFTHPDVHESKVANATALGIKVKPKIYVPPVAETTVTVLNGNGVAGAAADGAYLLRQRGYHTLLPPANLEPNAPTQGYFKTTIYFDPGKTGAKGAAAALNKVIVPSVVLPLPKTPALRALNPGSMLMVALGETFHNQLVSPDTAAPPPKRTPANVRSDASVGLELLRPYVHRVPFTLEVPTILERNSVPDDSNGDVAARLYWIDKAHKKKAIRLVFRTGANEYWGIEETNMPNPPILGDRSFQRSIKGRTFQLFYNGSHLQMVALRVHDRSYWVINTLLDSLSNETMLAIAKGLKPLPASK